MSLPIDLKQIHEICITSFTSISCTTSSFLSQESGDIFIAMNGSRFSDKNNNLGLQISTFALRNSYI